jgi:hypothetical protein
MNNSVLIPEPRKPFRAVGNSVSTSGFIGQKRRLEDNEEGGAFKKVAKGSFLSIMSSINEQFYEAKRDKVISESPHLMYSMLMRGSWYVENRPSTLDFFQTLLKFLVILNDLRDRINERDIWSSIGVNKIVEMYVDWQKGLLDSLPILYLPTYQNTPVTVTILPTDVFILYLLSKCLLISM